MIVTAFNSFNKIADFTKRCNTVVGWLDNINLFMGSGGTQGESVVTSQLLDSIKGDIENLATKVEGKPFTFRLNCFFYLFIFEWSPEEFTDFGKTLNGLSCLDMTKDKKLVDGAEISNYYKMLFS